MQIESIAERLRKNIADIPDAVVTVNVISNVMGYQARVINVAIGGIELSFSPLKVDNGAHGIDLDVLAAIRRAAGEDVADRPVSPDRPGKHFADIMSLE